HANPHSRNRGSRRQQGETGVAARGSGAAASEHAPAVLSGQEAEKHRRSGGTRTGASRGGSLTLASEPRQREQGVETRVRAGETRQMYSPPNPSGAS
ncbi:unnamed protein product, partial [Urochloa humidicola]